VTYHRIESPTQTSDDARRQQETGEIHGRPARGSDIPKVKAYIGKLGERRGIEFTTDVPPDPGCPPGQACWSGPREGVKVTDEHAKIKAVVTRNMQVG